MLLYSNVEASRRHPGALVVRSRPENDFHFESASWSDITRVMRGQDVLEHGTGKATEFEQSTTIHDAYQLALTEISGASLLELGFVNHIASPRALVLNSIALPALRETIVGRLVTGEPIPEEVFLAGLLQFVPEEARTTFYAVHPGTGSAEESIQLLARALSVHTGSEAVKSSYLHMMSCPGEVATLAHLVKSHQLMLAHLFAPADGVKFRESGYAMNSVFGDEKSPVAFERIVNRGQVLESIGR